MVSVLRRALDIAVELGVRYDNPATALKRVGVRPKMLKSRLTKEEITVRGDENMGPKNSEVCKGPRIVDMMTLLNRLRQKRPNQQENAPVVQVKECQKAMDRSRGGSH